MGSKNWVCHPSVTTWEVLYTVTDTQLCQVLGAMILALQGGLLVQKEHK